MFRKKKVKEVELEVDWKATAELREIKITELAKALDSASVLIGEYKKNEDILMRGKGG